MITAGSSHRDEVQQIRTPNRNSSFFFNVYYIGIPTVVSYALLSTVGMVHVLTKI